MSEIARHKPTSILAVLLTLTEIGMLGYWALAGALVAGWVTIAPEYMYSDYENPVIVAWNWSFFPIDVAFALCGLTARFATLRQSVAELLSVIGATLMFCAGVMAISFWVIQREFDPLWWGLNIWLCLLSILFLFHLMRQK